jgi:hypothetical protein
MWASYPFAAGAHDWRIPFLLSADGLTLTSERLLDEDKHLAKRALQRFHIVRTLCGFDQGTKVLEGGHLIHGLLHCVREHARRVSTRTPDQAIQVTSGTPDQLRERIAKEIEIRRGIA